MYYISRSDFMFPGENGFKTKTRRRWVFVWWFICLDLCFADKPVLKLNLFGRIIRRGLFLFPMLCPPPQKTVIQLKLPEGVNFGGLYLSVSSYACAKKPVLKLNLFEGIDFRRFISLSEFMCLPKNRF